MGRYIHILIIIFCQTLTLYIWYLKVRLVIIYLIFSDFRFSKTSFIALNSWPYFLPYVSCSCFVAMSLKQLAIYCFLEPKVIVKIYEPDDEEGHELSFTEWPWPFDLSNQSWSRSMSTCFQRKWIKPCKIYYKRPTLPLVILFMIYFLEMYTIFALISALNAEVFQNY